MWTVSGRYNKYMRGLPQTAWMIHDERKLETSVHELIADRVQELTKATGLLPHDQNAMYYLKIYFPDLRSGKDGKVKIDGSSDWNS